MRIVLDTNAALSALLWSGAPNRLLLIVRQDPQHQFFVSDFLIEELERVLGRPSPASQVIKIGQTTAGVLDGYVGITVRIAAPMIEPVIAADPDDDHVLAAALAAQADLIVSGDHHLRALGSYRGIRIVTPGQALALLEPG